MHEAPESGITDLARAAQKRQFGMQMSQSAGAKLPCRTAAPRAFSLTLYVTQRKIPSRCSGCGVTGLEVMVSEVPVDVRADDAAEVARSHQPRCAPYAA